MLLFRNNTAHPSFLVRVRTTQSYSGIHKRSPYFLARYPICRVSVQNWIVFVPS